MFQLREQRLDTEEALAELKKTNEANRKESDSLGKREKLLSTAVQNLVRNNKEEEEKKERMRCNLNPKKDARGMR